MANARFPDNPPFLVRSENIASRLGDTLLRVITSLMKARLLMLPVKAASILSGTPLSSSDSAKFMGLNLHEV